MVFLAQKWWAPCNAPLLPQKLLIKFQLVCATNDKILVYTKKSNKKCTANIEGWKERAEYRNYVAEVYVKFLDPKPKAKLSRY